MYLFFEKDMRGGLFHISKIYSKAISNYLKSYHRIQESKHIIYLCANNLHRYGMSKYFPTGGFKWIDPKEFEMNIYT